MTDNNQPREQSSEASSEDNSRGIDRRTVLKGAAAGAGIAGMPGLAVAKNNGNGPPDDGNGPPDDGSGPPNNGPPGQSCGCPDGTFLAKYDFENCSFELAEGEDVIEIMAWESKGGEDCEPVAVTYEGDGYLVEEICAFGGMDTDTDDDPDGEFESDLTNPGGQQAAISNITFCGTEEETFPECPLYGTSRTDPTAIFRIEYDTGTGEIVETEVGNIPDEFPNSNYPNGVALDEANDVWFFTEQDGTLKTMNEDGSLGINVYSVISPPGYDSVAGAAFWDTNGEYLFIPQDDDTLRAADISGGNATTRTVAGLNWSGIGLGDLAIDQDNQTLYVSTTRTNESGPNFFSVDLTNPSDQTEIVAAPRSSTDFATGKQIAFAETVLWAHQAEGGDWWTVDTSDGSMGDVVDTTKEYTDIARCGFVDN